MKTALLVSTYNWKEALELFLLSVQQQVELPDELIIADDGSKEDTRKLIDSFKTRFPIPIIHIWHKDTGFKKSIILNKSIVKIQADYVIQVDGDCILHPCFVKDHKRFAEKGCYLYGSRVSIKKEFLSKLFSTKKTKFNFFSKGIKKRTRTLHFPFFASFYKPENSFSKKFRGCNFSFWRDDFIAVNGYNEEMTGWGREDSELAIRMLNHGTKGKRIRYAAIVYHIWHKIRSRKHLTVNDLIQQEAIDKKLLRCNNGVDKYY